MKHFMLPRNTVLKDTQQQQLQTDSSSIMTTPNSGKSKTPLRRTKSSKENAPPDLNSPLKMKSSLPPRPPSSNPLKRKLHLETVPENALAAASDSGVKVVVRMRPPSKDEESGEVIVSKLSNDSLSINGQTFTFDSVADPTATQLDIFQLVGGPLVENCLAGFNSSVFAYGQTGSGKTYTMWGPSNALLDENLLSDQQGLTPRVFQRLFARIDEEQNKHIVTHLNYRCRCSFLEIYNEQITDLLDPSQRNLQIREDVKSGLYVENLTEERVENMKDVTNLLIKGLSNRRTGATSINSDSSRSHSVFTCVVECRYKNIADGMSRLKTSRINLVDLAGSERQKLTGAAGDRLKEAGNINRSLSQLGNLINILAEVSQTGKQRHIPYRDSKLTFLLQESLGGNAKLMMVCAVSPAQSCKSETFSTLRFAQRAKAIKNKAEVNEEMQDDVNTLREIIRQLKDELNHMKATGNNPAGAIGGGCSAGWARRSLSLLKQSLGHPRTLPHVDNDSDEEMEIDEDAVENLTLQVMSSSRFDKPVPYNAESGCVEETDPEDTDNKMEVEMSEEIVSHELMVVDCVKNSINNPGSLKDVAPNCKNQMEESENPLRIFSESCPGICASLPSLSMVPCETSPILKSPAPSVSPRTRSSRKNLRISSNSTASQNFDNNDGSNSLAEQLILQNSTKSDCPKSLAAQTCKKLVTTEHLASSLHRGLEIIDSHRQSVAMRRSIFRFSYKPAEPKPIDKVNVGVQTMPEDTELPEEEPGLFLCDNCKNRTLVEAEEINDQENLQLVVVPVDNLESAGKSKKQVPKAVEKVLAGSIRREMALEEVCAKQNTEIRQLNRLVQQYKHERECNAIIGQTREDKIIRLESLMDGVLPTEEFMEEELASLRHEHKLLKDKYENHPEVLRTEIEMKRLEDELERYRNFYDIGEKEVLLEEIQDLRSQLQCYVDSSSTSSRKRRSLLKLTYSCEANITPPLIAIPESNSNSAEEKLEQERISWTKAESKWISLCDELKNEIKANKSLINKQKHEIDTEKRCTEELKEALQMAMEGHARMLEQYADLEEKHILLLARHREIQDGIVDVKKAAAKAGVRGAESKFINSLAAEISALKAEKEKERRYFRDEIKGLQAQLRDTAEAVQAAGELLVRLKEAEEKVAGAKKRVFEAEQETEKAYQHIDKLQRKHEKEKKHLNEQLAESRLPNDAPQPAAHSDSVMIKYDVGEPHFEHDEKWKEEFGSLYNGEDGELSKLTEPSLWFSGYDRCNI
ncbi:hypothetical protein ACFE04_004191 [Oxalis oulophora]